MLVMQLCNAPAPPPLRPWTAVPVPAAKDLKPLASMVTTDSTTPEAGRSASRKTLTSPDGLLHGGGCHRCPNQHVEMQKRSPLAFRCRKVVDHFAEDALPRLVVGGLARAKAEQCVQRLAEHA